MVAEKMALNVFIKNLQITIAFSGICGVPYSHIIFQIPLFLKIKLMYK
jgi:hypothetical protein